MRRPGRRVGWIAMLLVCLVGAPAFAQTQLQLPPGSPALPRRPEEPPRAPITITPSLTIAGEYNDNIFQNNASKVSDFILGFTPGITVAAESSTYRLLGSYNFTSELYKDQDQLNDAFARQNLLIDATYRATPLLTLALTDNFLVNKNTNVIAAENVSTGRTRSTSNILSPGVSYQFDPRIALRARGTWTTQHYDTPGALDSNTYALEGFVDYALTPRLTLITGYQFAYFAIDQVPDTTTHTPRFGASYRFTPTLTGTLTAGPTIIVPEGNGSVSVTPAVTAALQAVFSWGSATFQYDRAVGTAGGLGGTTENNSVGAVIQVDRIIRNLILQAAPRYTTANSTSGTTGQIDVQSFSLTLQGRYQFHPWMAAIGGYTFFLQRANTTVTTGAGSISATDVDQNRVFVGIQFGYPITFQ